MVGAGMKVKVPLLVAVPPGVVTVMASRWRRCPPSR